MGSTLGRDETKPPSLAQYDTDAFYEGGSEWEQFFGAATLSCDAAVKLAH
jgi:hypothetical protein